jgi:hypothetical protein
MNSASGCTFYNLYCTFHKLYHLLCFCRLYNLSPLSSSSACRPPGGGGGGHAYTHSGRHSVPQHAAAAAAAFPEEAPPAYNDIFPEGYQYNKEEPTQPP